jgi:thiol peroxidase
MQTYRRVIKTRACLLIWATAIAVAGCDSPHEGKEKPMQERTGLVTLKGNPVTLVGPEVKVGQPAPDIELTANDLSTVKLSSFKGKVCIITSVPSLDTPVCDTETRRFNEAASRMGDDVVLLAVSMDLPFAQARWCGAAGVKNVRTLSDHRDAAFGTSYGVLIKGLRLLARAVFVVDRQGVVRYTELVKEVASEPDYEAALAAAGKLL